MCLVRERGRNSVTMWSLHKRMMIMHNPLARFTFLFHFLPPFHSGEATWGNARTSAVNLLLFPWTFRSHIYVYVGIKEHKFNALWKSRRVNLSVFPWNFPRKQNTIELHYVAMGKRRWKCILTACVLLSHSYVVLGGSGNSLGEAETACSFEMIFLR